MPVYRMGLSHTGRKVFFSPKLHIQSRQVSFSFISLSAHKAFTGYHRLVMLVVSSKVDHHMSFLCAFRSLALPFALFVPHFRSAITRHHQAQSLIYILLACFNHSGCIMPLPPFHFSLAVMSLFVASHMLKRTTCSLFNNLLSTRR
jgi:hypothetical protein